MERIKILVLCTGNSCRSQMAEGFLKSFDSRLDVFSAGVSPATRISSKAIKVMNELGIDISKHFPKDVQNYINDEFDYVITVCDNAKESCPLFAGKVKHRLHIGFEDPYLAKGSDKEVLAVYRRVRDEIREDFFTFYKSMRD